VIPAIIYIVVPALGLASFVQIRRQMRVAGVPEPPVAALFWLFVTYGGLLLVILTVAFWEWSGLASLGMAFLVLCAPVLLGVQAWRLRPRAGVSSYHRLAWLLSRGYVLLAGLGIACWLIAGLLSRGGAAQPSLASDERGRGEIAVADFR
jgi:hypothetical protein